MKTFKEYIADELLFEEISQEVEQALYELNLIKAVSKSVSRVIKSNVFKKAIMLWRQRMKSNKYPDETPVDAAFAVALQTDKLEPRQFVDHLKSLKLIKA